MILNAEQMKQRSMIEGISRTVNVTISVAGQQGLGCHSYIFEIFAHDVMILRREKSVREHGFARLALMIIIDIIWTLSTCSNFLIDTGTLIVIDMPLWNSLDPIIRGTISDWYHDEDQCLRKKNTTFVKNQDLWNVLMYLSKFVTIGLIETDRTQDWYKELHEKAREKHQKDFNGERKLPEELKKSLSMSRSQVLRRKQARTTMIETNKRIRKIKRKLKQ